MYRNRQTILFWQKALMCAFVLMFSSLAWGQEIHVTVNGDPVAFAGSGPVQINGRVMVPVRGVLEKLGAKVEWVPATQTVVASTDSVTIQLHLGDRLAVVNGKAVLLDVPAQSIGGHTLVPLRFLGEALGADVRWQDSTRTVLIQVKGSDNPPPVDPPVASGAAITGLTIASDAVAGWLQPGQQIRITLDGTPGGQASFHITGVTEELPLQETDAGHYVGQWTVPTEQDIQVSQASVVGSLKVGERAAAPRTAPQFVSIDTVWPVLRDPSPERDSHVESMRPNISAAFDDRNGSGVNPAKIRLLVNDEDVTADATVTRSFVLYSPKDPLPPGRQHVRLLVPDRAGNVAEITWNFSTDEKPADVIQSFQDNTGDVRQIGDTLHIEMMGAPGGAATFSLGNIRDIPLREISPGRYATDYRIRESDDPSNSRLVLRMITRSGERFVRQTDRSFTLLPPQPINVTPDAPTISGISLVPDNPSGWLQAGQHLKVLMEGTPGGLASFRVGELSGDLRMSEVAPGHYAGNWQVPNNRSLQQSDLTALISLTVGNQTTRRYPTNRTVAVDTVWPTIYARSLSPHRDIQTNELAPTISATFDDPNGSGVDRRRIRLEVNGREVTNGATIRPDSISYTPRDAFAPGRQTVHLIVPDRAGNVADTTWSFMVAPGAADAIKSVRAKTDTPFQPGDVLHIEMMGLSGGAATFSAGNIQNVPLAEVSAGRYAVDYTIRRRDASDNARIIVKLTLPNGTQYTQETGYAVSIQSPVTVPNPAPTIKSLTFAGSNRSGWLQSGQRLTITLEGAPGGTALFRINTLTNDLPLRESPAGHYTGVWTVPNNLQMQRGDLILTASLQVGGAAQRAQADKPVEIDTIWPVISNLVPARDSQSANTRPTLSAAFTDPNGSGVDRAKVRLEVNGHDVTSMATVRADSISYTPKDPLAPGKQTIHLVVVDNAGNLAETTWYITVR